MEGNREFLLHLRHATDEQLGHETGRSMPITRVGLVAKTASSTARRRASLAELAGWLEARDVDAGVRDRDRARSPGCRPDARDRHAATTAAARAT